MDAVRIDDPHNIVEEEYDANEDELVASSSLVASFGGARTSFPKKDAGRETSRKPAVALENSPFEVTAKFEPTGDQPEAIRQLLLRLQEHEDRFSVLQGITGTG